MIDLAGLDVPEEMQGRSIFPLLRGEKPVDWRQAIYYRYWQHLLHRNVTAHYGIRTHTHKLIYFHGKGLGIMDFPDVDPEWELYDLVADPAEMTNLYHDASQQSLILQLKEQLLELKDQFDDRDQKYPEMTALNKEHFWRTEEN